MEPTRLSATVDFKAGAFSDMPTDLQGVWDYWRVLSENRFAPIWKEFDMLEIPTHYLSATMVKDVEEGPRTYRYRFYGSQLVALNHRDLMGLTTDDINFPALSSAVRQSLGEFVEQRKPQFYQLDCHYKFGEKIVQYILRLPISNDGKTVTNVASIIWTEFRITA